MTSATVPAHTTAAPAAEADLEALAETVRRHAADCDEHARFPHEALALMRSSGLLGLLVPASHGGMGGSLSDMLRISALLARDCLSTAMIFAMHCQQVAAVRDHAAPELRDRLLRRIAAGEVYLASVTTGAATGGHLLTADPALRTAGDHLVLDRVAPVVTGGRYADAFLVTTQAPDAVSPHEVSLVYAERGRLEAEVTGEWNSLGMRATDSVPMRLRGPVPVDQVIGGHGNFRHVTVTTFAPLAHLGWAACWLGTATGALSRTVGWLRGPGERKRRDLSGELLLTRLSKARQRLETVHALLRHATQVYADGVREVSTPSVQSLLNTVKITASEQCLAAVDDLVELAGLAQGYLRGTPLALERALRDLRSASLNYSNDRLHTANGALTLQDRAVRFA
ncbi:acyl-CoA dehydrogenase family protein [Streptomyces sp. 7R007]